MLKPTFEIWLYLWVNLVEIHVDFANRFCLEAMYEIGLNSMGKFRLFPLSYSFESLCVIIIAS